MNYFTKKLGLNWIINKSSIQNTLLDIENGFNGLVALRKIKNDKNNQSSGENNKNENQLDKILDTFQNIRKQIEANQKILNSEHQKTSKNSKNSNNEKSENSNSNKNDEKFDENLFQRYRAMLAIVVFQMIMLPSLLFHHFGVYSRAKEITFKDFIKLYVDTMSNSQLNIIVSGDDRVYIRNGANKIVHYFNIGSAADFEKRLNDSLQARNLTIGRDIVINYEAARPRLTRFVVLLLGLYLFMFATCVSWMMFPKRLASQFNDAMSFQGNRIIKRREFKPIKSQTKFSDVIGYNEQKTELLEFVKFMTDPKKFNDFGAKTPRGAILHGPPGTGKTLLAKAIAGEAGVNFFSTAGPEFIEVFVGVGPQRVRDLFETAKKNSPCIIFIDEIDTIAAKRSHGGPISSQEHESTLNQLLALMDGFETNENVVVLAATNRFNSIDPAILRPGRLDRHLFFGPLDYTDRIDMFKYYFKKIPLVDGIDIASNHAASLTTGFVGADISMICNESAIIAARKNCNSVQLNHINQAIDRVIAGNKTSKKLTQYERYVLSIVESSKAVVSWFSEFAQPVLKVNITPRGNELSYSQKFVKEEYLQSQEKLRDTIRVLFGGRAAEDIILKQNYTLSGNDLLNATRLAYQTIGVYGMEKDVGPVSYKSLLQENNRSSIFPIKREYNDQVGDKIDDNVKRILSENYECTKQLVDTHKDLIIKLAKFLYKNEQASSAELIKILGPRQFTTPELQKIDDQTF